MRHLQTKDKKMSKRRQNKSRIINKLCPGGKDWSDKWAYGTRLFPPRIALGLFGGTLAHGTSLQLPCSFFPLRLKLFNKTGVSCQTCLPISTPCWQLRPSGGRTVCVAVRQCGSESKRDWAHDRNLEFLRIEMKPNSGSSGSKNSGAQNSEFQIITAR